MGWVKGPGFRASVWAGFMSWVIKAVLKAWVQGLGFDGWVKGLVSGSGLRVTFKGWVRGVGLKAGFKAWV